MDSIVFIMPYFGTFPEWFDLFLETCRHNPTISWVFITNCESPASIPPNAKFVQMTWDECISHIGKTLGIPFSPASPYKLCDLRFAFPTIFEEVASGYDFIAFGDIDVLYGNLRAFLTPSVLGHDLITFKKAHVSGHFTLLRNVPRINHAYERLERWREDFSDPRHLALDEKRSHYGIRDVFAAESYSTALSPCTPWHDGSFQFPATWFWHQGVLSNNLVSDRQYLYLHFMHYKFHWRNEEKSGIRVNRVRTSPTAPFGWKLQLDGFVAAEEGESEIQTNERLGWLQAGDRHKVPAETIVPISS